MDERKTYGRFTSKRMLIAINVVLITALIVSFVAYSGAYRQELRNRNIAEIENITVASASSVSATFDGISQRVSDSMHLIDARSLTVDQTLEYFRDLRFGNDIDMQIVALGGKGFSSKMADGQFVPVDYSSYGYANIEDVFVRTDDEEYGVVQYAPEFTDQSDGHKVVAAYTYLRMRDNSGSENDYVLMCTEHESVVADEMAGTSDFEGLSMAVMDQDGGYLLGANGFKSTDFFQFLYVYNNLTLDQKNAIINEVHANERGVLNYRNAQGVDCVYSYVLLGVNNWYAVSCVPESSLQTSGFDLRFALIVLIVAALLIGVDVVTFSRMNKVLAKSIVTAEKASEAKTDFLSRMSHDIRTPLNVIIGMSSLAYDQKNPPKTQEYLGNIDSASRFLLGLVNDILDLNKVEAGKMELASEPYAFGEFRHYIYGVVKPLCDTKQIELIVDAQYKGGNVDDLVIMTDSLRFNQIFFNLFSNSIKFTPEQGRILFDINVTPAENDTCHIVARITDSGCGMSKQFQDHMFEVFSQERAGAESGGGSGLGLSIVTNLVDLMGGTIQVESELGEGSTFTVTMDCKLADKNKVVDEPCVDLSVCKGKHVLIVEDNPLNQLIVTELLKKRDISFETAENGQAGVDVFEASTPGHFDAILMDMQMPVMDGLEATRAIRALDHPNACGIPIIAMTANAYVQDVEACLEAGMNTHLAKPLESEKLYETLAHFWV